MGGATRSSRATRRTPSHCLCGSPKARVVLHITYALAIIHNRFQFSIIVTWCALVLLHTRHAYDILVFSSPGRSWHTPTRCDICGKPHRWGKGYFGPGFAVETQEKYRLGWLRVSQTPAGVTGSVEGGEPARSVPAMSRPARRRRGFFRLGRTGVDTEVDAPEIALLSLLSLGRLYLYVSGTPLRLSYFR